MNNTPRSSLPSQTGIFGSARLKFGYLGSCQATYWPMSGISYGSAVTWLGLSLLSAVVCLLKLSRCLLLSGAAGRPSVAGLGRCYQRHGERRRQRGLAFANVAVRGAATSTGANEQGQYQLRLPAGSYELVFQYVGYRPQHRAGARAGRRLHPHR